MKRVLSVVLVVSMLISAVACGKRSGEAEKKDPEQQTRPAEASTDEKTEAEEELTDAKKIGVIRISFNGDMYEAEAYCDADNNIFLPYDALEVFAGSTLAGAFAGMPEKTVTIEGRKWFDATAFFGQAPNGSCAYEPALQELYIWTDMPAGDYTADEARIAYYGLGEGGQETITFRQYFELLDKVVAIADPDKLAEWQEMLPEARGYDGEMTRFEGVAALLYAAVTLGEPYNRFTTAWWEINEEIGTAIWDETTFFWEDPERDERLPLSPMYDMEGFDEVRPDVTNWRIEAVAAFFGFGRDSLLNKKLLFDYDSEAKSMHYDEPLTRYDALCALTRFLDSERIPKRSCIAAESGEALHYNTDIITREHLAIAASMPDVSDENLPVWNGAVLSCDGSYAHDILDTDTYFRKLSEYGFNTVRYMIPYDMLFDRHVTVADKAMLDELDVLVSLAIRYRLHLNLVLVEMPGRWSIWDEETYTNVGEFDLFTNQALQEEADRVWRIIAARYADIPNSVLSFSPLWEVTNPNLSTGLPWPSYTMQDVAAEYVRLINVIRGEDEERFIIYEPTSNNMPAAISDEAADVAEAVAGYKNVQMLVNFCQMPYVYAEMTAEEDMDIDMCNHAMFKPSYPTVYYGVRWYVDGEHPLEFKGELAEGTVINLYLAESNWGGRLAITGDGEVLFEEDLGTGQKDYRPHSRLSGYWPYAKSDKLISITLEKEYEELVVTSEGYVVWCGIDVTLPQEYAVERWWYDSAYDAFLEGREWEPPTLKETSLILISPSYETDAGTVTINPDVTFSTDVIANAANAETSETFIRAAAELAPRSAARCEAATFMIGTDYESEMRYYDDFMSVCEKYEIGWYMNDVQFGSLFRTDMENTWTNVVGASYTRCSEVAVLKELLELFQSHMETPVRID